MFEDNIAVIVSEQVGGGRGEVQMKRLWIQLGLLCVRIGSEVCGGFLIA